MRTQRRIRSRGKGLQIAGPGFYLWDLDAREALRLAAELSRRPLKVPAPQRRAPLRGPAA
jgi:hypothetical protein